MTHPYQHPDASFSYSQQQQHNIRQPLHVQQLPQPSGPIPSTTATTPKPPRKAKRCRKKHPPVGPAGIWFLSRSKNAGKIHNRNHNPNASSAHNNHPFDGTESPSSSHDDPDLSLSPTSHSTSLTSSSSSSVGANPAWTAMQCTLQWFTPDLPLSLNLTSVQRYRRLRPHVPPHYTLLPEIAQQNTSWKLPAGQKLVVLVVSVSCHHDDIWTVELQDDTGASIQAWMQPSFVQTEKQQHADNATGPHYIRPGYVWCLEHVTVMLQQSMGGNTAMAETDNNDNDDNTPDHNNNNKAQRRMLLISERNVTQVWTPDSLQQIQGPVFCNWVEQRNDLQRQWDDADRTRSQTAAANSHNNQNGTGGNRGDGSAFATTNNRFGTNNGDDESSEEEEEDDEDRYRRQQHHQQYARRTASLPRVDEEDNMGTVVGGPIIRSLHTPGSSTIRTPPPRNMLMMSSQQQQQPYSQSQTAVPQTTRPTLSQARQSTAEANTESDDTTAMLMRSLRNQSQSPHAMSQQAQRPMPNLPAPPLFQPGQHPRNNMSNTVTPRQPAAPHLSQQPVRQPPNGMRISNTVTPGQSSAAKSSHPPAQQAAYQNQRPTPQRQQQFQNQMVPQQGQQSLPGGIWNQRTTASPNILQQQQQIRDAGTSNTGGSRRVSFSQLPAPPMQQPHPTQTQRSQPSLAQQSAPTRHPNKENQRQHTGTSAVPAHVKDDALLSANDKAAPRNQSSIDLSQFSATAVESALINPKAGPSGDPAKGNKALQSPSLATETTTPPKKRSDDKSRRKTKARYDESPLSQSPKPSTATLWTSTALLDGAGLLDLSSDDEDEAAPTTTYALQSKKPAETTNLPAEDSNPKELSAAFACGATGNVLFGGGVSSIFQATSSLPGMDWMGLSDDDDD